MKAKRLFAVGILAASVFTASMQTTSASAAAKAPATQKGDLIIINKQYNQLAFFHDGKFKMVKPVATGRTWKLTPVGHWKVVQKIKNRPYYKGKIPGGDPRNPLGNRWLGLNAAGTNGSVYGIHGNNNPSSIGKYASSGCVRMYDADVEKLYDQVKIGTPVKITSSNKSFKDLAALYKYKVTGWDTK